MVWPRPVIVATRADPAGGSLSRIASDIFLVMGATGAAQVLAFAAAPLLTRLYEPEAFGRFAVFNAILAILCPLTSLRYDWAIPLPSDDGQACNLLALSVALVLGFSCVAALILLGASGFLSAWTGMSGVQLMLLPLALAALGLNGAMLSWLTRERAFPALARVRVVTTLGAIAGQVAFCVIRADATGLMLGWIAGYMLGLATGAGRCRAVARRAAGAASLAALWRVAVEHRAFAVITAPGNVLNAFGSQLPSLVFPSIYGLAVTGQFSLAQRALAQPVDVVCAAVNQVFWGNAARLFQQAPERLWPLFLRLNLILLATMVPGAALIWFGPQIFAGLFGPAWAEAGRYAGLLVVASFFGLAAQGTTSLHIYRLNHWMGAWEVLKLILVAAALWAAAAGPLRPVVCVAAVSAALAIASAVLLGLNAIAVRRPPNYAAGGRPPGTVGNS